MASQTPGLYIILESLCNTVHRPKLSISKTFKNPKEWPQVYREILLLLYFLQDYTNSCPWINLCRLFPLSFDQVYQLLPRMQM